MEVVVLTNEEAVWLVGAELARSVEKHGHMLSRHDGMGIIQEEVNEMWKELEANNDERLQRECIQVAAMALKFLIDFNSFQR